MMGITEDRKDFDFSQMVVCDACHAYGRYRVFMIYTVLSLFCIPCFKWNRRYYVQSSCCNALFELDAEIGARIAHGEDVEILPEHLKRAQSQGYGVKRCANCGYATNENFEFCPKCGRKF